jgi:hypothetical protein
MEWAHANNKKILFSAPTHKAKNRFGPDAVTVSKMVGVRPGNDDDDDDVVDMDDVKGRGMTATLRRIANTFDIIVVDEASMVSIELWTRIVKLKEFNPNLIFVIAGDPRQLGPVYPSGDGGRSGHHMHASFVKWLCHENLVTLTVPKRSQDTRLFDLADDIHEGRAIRHAPKKIRFGSKSMPTLVLTSRNSHRVAINAHQMRRLKPGDAKLLRISAMYADGVKGASQAKEYGQDMWVYPGLPLACMKTSHGGNDVGDDNVDDDDDADDEGAIGRASRGSGRMNVGLAPIEIAFHLVEESLLVLG